MTTQHNAADTAAGPHWPAPRPTCTHKLYPNVDLYFIFQAMGFPVDMLPVLFAIGRMAGWLAQWREGKARRRAENRMFSCDLCRRGAQTSSPRGLSGIVRSDAR